MKRNSVLALMSMAICLAAVTLLFPVIKAQTNQTQKAELIVQTGHTNDINSVAFSPDGKTLASGSGDETIKLWDVESGNELRTLRGHKLSVSSVAFTSDGKTLASGSDDKTIKIWDVETGKEVRTLTGPTSWITSIAFSSNGKRLTSASGGEDKKIRVWNVETGELLRSFAGQSRVAASPDDKILASVGDNFTIKLWNTETGAEIRTLAGHADGIRSIEFSPDSKILATGSNDKTVKVWDVATGNELLTLRGHTHWVTSVKFSPDGLTLASGSADDTLKLWDVRTGNELRAFPGHPNPINSIAFSPDGGTLASGDGSHNGSVVVTLWNVKTGKEMRTLRQRAHNNNAPAVFSPDNKTLAIPTVNRAIKLWDLATGREPKSLPGHAENVFTALFSPDNKMLATGSFDKTIKLWDVETGKELKTLTGHADMVLWLEFSSDSKRLMSVSGDKIFKLWDLETGKELKSLPQDSAAARLEMYKANPGAYDKDNRYSSETRTDARWQAKRAENGKIDLIESATGQIKASLIAIDETDWAVVTPEGLFDGSPAAWKIMWWRLDGNTFRYAPVEAFFSEFYRPGLLQDIVAGKTIEKPTRDISTIDIRQPKVKVTPSDASQNTANMTTRQTTVNVEIKDAPADQRRTTTSGAKDVRLFRNGSLVKVWRGDVLNGKQSATLSATVPVVAGNNTFTAYAFNNDNVKSSDATLVINGAESLKRPATAYILAVGVNSYSNQDYNLKYAVADAQEFASEVKRRQEALKRYGQVEVIPLADSEATKANIMQSLTRLTSRVQPEDTLIVYFAGHGTAQQNRFYLIPHDLGYDGSRTSLNEAGLQAILAHSISDVELEQAFENIDAGQILLVIDACNSGQALEAEEKRRGPMNSKGLAQLAYEKGMYVLTAAQSYQAAQEATKLGHGYLTYALVEAGLKRGAADREPRDDRIDLHEWLNYATDEVPRMQEENLLEALRGKGRQLVFVGDGSATKDTRSNVQRPRIFYRRESELQPFIIANLGASPRQ
jgi:WD40 repeat protein